MASRSLSELWLRPSSFGRTIQICTSRKRTLPFSWSSQRGISKTPYQAAQPQLKEVEEEEEQQYNAQNPPSPPRQPSRNEPLRELHTLFHKFPDASQAQTSSSEDMRTARQDHVFGSNFSPPGRSQFTRRPQGLNLEELEFPDSMMDPTLSNKPSEATSLKLQQEETFANFPRLNPAYGRMVELDASRGRDLVRGISMLSSLVARNKLRHDLNKQKFHERAGLKRKRLKSERWRARFKIGFDHVTRRVTELTKKGW